MYALEEMFVCNYPSKLNSFLLKRYAERQFHLLLIKCVLLATTLLKQQLYFYQHLLCAVVVNLSPLLFSSWRRGGGHGLDTLVGPTLH